MDLLRDFDSIEEAIAHAERDGWFIVNSGITYYASKVDNHDRILMKGDNFYYWELVY